jgi:hypothetical protein
MTVMGKPLTGGAAQEQVTISGIQSPAPKRNLWFNILNVILDQARSSFISVPDIAAISTSGVRIIFQRAQHLKACINRAKREPAGPGKQIDCGRDQFGWGSKDRIGARMHI